MRFAALGLLNFASMSTTSTATCLSPIKETRYLCSYVLLEVLLDSHQSMLLWICFANTLGIRLQRLIDETEPPCFIHYDLHPGNIRITRDTDGRWQFLTLLDFEMARAWLPEQDLAVLSWYLRGFDDGWWDAFLRGYGQTNPLFEERIRLFEMIKSLGVMVYSEQADWRHWCRARIDALLAC